MSQVICSVCQVIIPPAAPADITSGYGYDEQKRPVCYRCCALADRAYMLAHGRITLYLTNVKDPARRAVSNWPSSLSFKAGRVAESWHNIAGVRYDTWFTGPDGHWWHAIQYGDNTEIAHCKRTRDRWAPDGWVMPDNFGLKGE